MQYIKVSLVSEKFDPRTILYLWSCGKSSHFLFKCPKFNAFRRELLLTVSNYVEPSEAVLLLGDDTLSDEGNEVIFRAVHKYIQQTKRFSSNT